MTVEGVVADFVVEELGGFAVGVAVGGVVGADVVWESVIGGVVAGGGGVLVG